MSNSITSDIVYQLINVGDPSLSPDGARVAFAKSSIDRESMETHSHVMMMDVDSGEASRFTSGDKDSGPKFSPGGATLAFLRPDDKGRKQIWSIPTAGGEALKLTDVPGGISDVAWSPDSGSIAFISDVDPDLLPDDHDPKIDPRVREVHRIRYRADGIGWRGDAFRHVFVVDVESGETRQITDGEGEDSAPAWSPDGATIAFVSDRGDDREILNRTDAYSVSASGGDIEHLSDGLNSVAALTWSPDGDAIAVAGSDVEDASAGWQSWLFALESGRKPRKLTDDSISPAGGYAPLVPAPEMRWTSDGRVLFLAGHQGQTTLFSVSLDNEELRQITAGGAGIGQVTFSAGAARAVIQNLPTDSAGDLVLIDVESGSTTQLTDYNRDFLQENPAARVEKFSIHRVGYEIESRLMFPSDSYNAIQQVMTGSGYLVLAVNPRGSSTYGVDFVKAVLRDWGGEDYRDIMASVDEVCTRDYVDSSRLGVTGYSYGGFMSSWIVGHDTRFKGAVIGAPCTNLSSMYGTSDIGVRFGEAQWGGVRKDALDAFLEHSPLTYAPNVETPVLLLHGEADLRVPMEQSEQYYVTLKRLGKVVEFVRFPGGYHGFVRGGHPRMREEYLSRLVAWMDEHVGSEAIATEAPEPEAVPADD
jgi:dipeptidyl aminopeptidase/acylaminoacyl peptidase